MLYQAILAAGLLAVSLAQDDETDVVDVELASTEGPDDDFETSSGDLIASSLFSTDDSSDFESSLESTNSGDSDSDDDSDDDDDEDDDDDTDDDDMDDDTEDEDDDDDDDDDTDDTEEDDDNSETSQEGDGDDDDDEEDEEDECTELPQSDCTDLEGDDGDQECGFNVQTGECYSIERRNGEYGSGNYDDGYRAAKQTAAEESSQLYTVVGILSGVIGALVLVIAGGAYYFYNKNKVYDMSYDVEREMNQIRASNDEDGDGEELIKTVEDVSPVVTRS